MFKNQWLWGETGRDIVHWLAPPRIHAKPDSLNCPVCGAAADVEHALVPCPLYSECRDRLIEAFGPAANQPLGVEKVLGPASVQLPALRALFQDHRRAGDMSRRWGRPWFTRPGLV